MNKFAFGSISFTMKIIYQCDLRYTGKYGFMYAEIIKGMYGIPQVGIIANNLHTKNISPHGY